MSTFFSIGATSVHFQMLNEESRKYFNRALVISNTAFSGTALFKENHVEHMQKCLQIKETNDIVEFIKTSNITILRDCYSIEYLSHTPPHWTPTIEIPNAISPFLTKTPDEIYSSDNAPVMDAMFSFATQVCREKKLFFRSVLSISSLFQTTKI